jgi:hypothetical protein
MPPTKTPRETTTAILAGLSIADEYRALGVEIVGEPRSSGMVSCRAFGRDDRKPSAWLNIKTGYYGDSGGEREAAYTCSLWDFAVRTGKFADWQEARRAYAKKAGVEIGRMKKSEGTDWRKKLEFQQWEAPGNDVLALRWCLKSKRGVTVEAIKAAGGQIAYYPCWFDQKKKEKVRAKSCRQVVALPCYGDWGLAADPVAWVIWDLTGEDFDVTPKDYPADQPRVRAKMISVGPTRGAMMGLAGLMSLTDPEARAQIAWTWKTAGPTDLLGLMSAIPPDLKTAHVVVTNASGETGDVSPTQAKLLAGLRVAVVGDRDEAGTIGAAKWCRALDGLADQIRNVELPWPIEPKHGKDLRDYLADHTYADLLALAEATPPWTRPPEASTAPTDQEPTATSASPTDQQIDQFTDAQITRAMQIDVLGRTEAGEIRVYSEFLARTVTVANIAKLKYPDLLLHFGTPVRKCVSKQNDDDVPGRYAISDVRDALAHLASQRVLGEETELGLGCWPVEDDGHADNPDQAELNAVVLVNTHEAAHFNGEFRRINHPRHNGRILSFETGAAPWYDFDQLAGLLKTADDQTFRYAVVDDLVKLWSRWRWQGQHSPIMAAGLVLATWVQSLWAWRPRIDVLGASNTGKSMFCAALAGLYRGLCLLTSDTTAAGLRQKIANRMLAVVVDEVDAKNKTKLARQREILEMIRSASRGTAAIRGSGNQKAVEFTLRHLVWVAGITLSYDDQADRNRAIILPLLPPLPEKAGKLALPPAAELADLGQRSLAAALWSIRRARKLAVQLKDQKVEGVDARLVESYAVPASMIAVVMGYDDEFANLSLRDMLADSKSDTPVESDEANLIAEILQATVALGQHRLTVGQAIEHVQDITASNRAEWRVRLESVGIQVRVSKLALNYGTARAALLRGTRWESQPIDQVLRRVPGATPSQQRIGGVKSRGITFNLNKFIQTYIGLPGDDEPSEKPTDGF